MWQLSFPSLPYSRTEKGVGNIPQATKRVPCSEYSKPLTDENRRHPTSRLNEEIVQSFQLKRKRGTIDNAAIDYQVTEGGTTEQGSPLHAAPTLSTQTELHY
jgi:hypothetical protein